MKRLPNETIEAYRARRKKSQTAIKNRLKGKAMQVPYGMPYKKPKDIPRQTFTKALRNARGYADYLAQKTFSV